MSTPYIFTKHRVPGKIGFCVESSQEVEKDGERYNINAHEQVFSINGEEFEQEDEIPIEIQEKIKKQIEEGIHKFLYDHK